MAEKRVSNRVRKAKELEERVAQWLTEEGAAFYPGDDFDSSLNIPIIMVDPFPMAFEVVPDAATFRMKSKRWIATRIRIAQLFGPHLPVAVIAEEGFEGIPERVRHLFDSILDARGLPMLDEIRNVFPSEELQGLFVRGQPSESAEELLTSPEAYTDLWADVLSLSDLVEKAHPKASLASRLRDVFFRFRDEQEEEALSSDSRMSSRTPLEQAVLSSRFRKLFDKEIVSFLGEHVAGNGRWIRFGIGKEGKLLQRQELAWEFPNGEVQVLRRSMAPSFEGIAAHRAEELFADAWMIRGSERAGGNRPLLLLGKRPMERIETTRGSASKPGSITLDMVNRFESSGWRVFPWDFDREMPRFVEYLASRNSVE